MSSAKGVEDACQAECVIVMQERIKKSEMWFRKYKNSTIVA